MTTLAGPIAQPMRSPWSFMGSVCLHAWILAWVALAPSIVLEKPKSLYEREIQPYEKKIVWYKLSERLPDVTPAAARHTAAPPRARTLFEQNIVVGAKDSPRPPQMILAPAPEIAPARALPLPNIVALAPTPRLIRPFLPPAPKVPAATPPPTLPDAPKVAAAEVKPPPIDMRAPRITRKFIPPTPKRIVPGAPAALPAAPEIAAASVPKPSIIDDRAPRIERRFTPPPSPKAVAAKPATLPDAPEIAAAATAGEVKIPVRKFAPPARKSETRAAPADLAPPPVATSPRALASDNSLVIAGLDPAKSIEVPAPPASVKSGFSGGPKPSSKGGESSSTDALLEVPSLTIQGGARNPQPPVMVASVSPTSPDSLAAAMRVAHASAPAGNAPVHQAVRVSNAPDPRMYGRQVYTMAIQVPNLTSYSGSWLVWFADRESDIGNAAVDMRPPLPVSMVSPKYIASAVYDHVQGKVRLWAVIGKDGRVTGVTLLQHLDDRLDTSAEEALAKWQFRPAVRNGVPVDVDAVFEVPFVLAPKPAR